MESERVVRVSQPDREIVALAAEQDADVVIMAEEPMNWLGRLLLGSVTAKVKRRASCAVLTLAAPARPKHGDSQSSSRPKRPGGAPFRGEPGCGCGLRQLEAQVAVTGLR